MRDIKTDQSNSNSVELRIKVLVIIFSFQIEKEIACLLFPAAKDRNRFYRLRSFKKIIAPKYTIK